MRLWGECVSMWEMFFIEDGASSPNYSPSARIQDNFSIVYWIKCPHVGNEAAFLLISFLFRFNLMEKHLKSKSQCPLKQIIMGVEVWSFS